MHKKAIDKKLTFLFLAQTGCTQLKNIFFCANRQCPFVQIGTNSVMRPFHSYIQGHRGVAHSVDVHNNCFSASFPDREDSVCNEPTCQMHARTPHTSLPYCLQCSIAIQTYRTWISSIYFITVVALRRRILNVNFPTDVVKAIPRFFVRKGV